MENTPKKTLPSERLGFITESGSCVAIGEVEADFKPFQVLIDGKHIDTQRAVEARYTVTRSREVDRFFESLETGPQANLVVNATAGMFLLAGLTVTSHELETGRRVTVLVAQIATQVK